MRIVRSIARWAAVFAAATAGSWIGRQIAASRHGEQRDPLGQISARTLLDQDVAPGFLAAELLGRNLRLGLAGEVILAATGAALSAIATGPFVEREPRTDVRSDRAATRGAVGAMPPSSSSVL